MLLPPLNYAADPSGDDAAGICSVIELLKQQDRMVRDIYVEWADVGVNYYTFGTNEADAESGVINTDKIIIQDIQNNLITSTNVETQDDPNITLKPVDTGQPSQFLWALDPAIATQLGIPPAEVQASTDPHGNMAAPAGLSPMSLMKVQQLIQAQQLPPSAIQEVSITQAAEMWQNIFNVVWNRGNFKPVWRRNCLMKNAQGWQPITLEFDDAKKRPIFKNLPIRQCFIDPTAEGVDDAANVEIDIVLAAEVAKGLYPKFADQIEQHAQQTGKIIRPPQTLEMGSQYEDVTYQQPVVTITVAFLRDQPCYTQPHEAVKAGTVNQQQVGTGMWDQQSGADGTTQHVEQQRDAYTHPETGEEVLPPDHDDFDPDNTQWPIKRCLRQITTIATASVVLEDCECKYWDIPLAINVCLPIFGKPFGIGDAQRLARMQDGRSDLVTAAVEHAGYFRAPMGEGPLSAREQLPEEFKDGHLHPGMMFWTPDEILAKHPQGTVRYIQPPPLPPVLMDVDDKLKREINDSSGNMDVVQGKDKQALSGVAIGMRQNAATTMIGFKSQTDEEVIERLAQLLFYAIRTRMTVADIRKVIKKYSDQVLEQLVAMGNVDDGLEWNISVKTTMGAGQKDQQKKDEAKDEQQRGAISMETLREELGRDNTQEVQRIEKQTMEQAKLQMAVQPPASPPGAAVAPAGGQASG